MKLSIFRGPREVLWCQFLFECWRCSSSWKVVESLQGMDRGTFTSRPSNDYWARGTSRSTNNTAQQPNIELQRVNGHEYSNDALDTLEDDINNSSSNQFEDCCDEPFVQTLSSQGCTLLTGAKRDLYQHVSNKYFWFNICQLYHLENQFTLVIVYILMCHQNPSLFFDDGVRKIDFVLVWDESNPSEASQSSVIKRKVFESNLEKEGLELERVSTPGVPLHFIKLHAPDEILRRYAEILKLRMPMKLVK